jgi:hypothetical protein
VILFGYRASLSHGHKYRQCKIKKVADITFWTESKATEMKKLAQNGNYLEVGKDGEPSKRLGIPVHMLHDVNHDARHKRCLLLDSILHNYHLTVYILVLSQ